MGIAGFMVSLHLTSYMGDIDDYNCRKNEGSVGKTLATQALEPGIHLQFPFTKMTYACNPSAGELDPKRSSRLSGQPAWPNG